MILLRPHHLLCVKFYVGKGYSKEFCDNMASLIDRLNSGETVTLVKGKDDLCAHCPHCINSICATKEKSDAFDQRVLTGVSLAYGTVRDYSQLKRLTDYMIATKVINGICKECNWLDLCQQNYTKLLIELSK